MKRATRLAVRAILLRDNRLCMVNAWPEGQSDLLCTPGGGVEPGQSLPENLVREVWEETGMKIAVGAPALVNEFHFPGGGFHQVDIYFWADILDGPPAGPWTDPAGVVTQIHWLTEAELATRHVKPDSLAAVVWSPDQAITYDPLEPAVR